MKIISLQAENIKRLVAVEIHPEGNLVEISGKNGQGKSSILDAIYWALGSQKVIQQKPVRDGQETGFIRLDLGDYIVTRKFKVKDGGEYTTSITVKNRDGATYNSPTTILEGFVGQLTFDPLDFARMKPADQKKALRALVPDFDFEENQAAIDRDFTERTIVNRKVNELTARLGGIPVIEDAPTERLSQDDVMAEIQDAMDKNAAVQSTQRSNDLKRRRVEDLQSTVARDKEVIARIGRELAIARQTLADNELALEEAEDEAGGLEDPELIDVGPLRQKLTEIEEMNRRFDRADGRRQIEKELEEAKAEAELLTKTIEANRANAVKAIATAKLPIDGLAATDDGIFVNGVPFAQMSDAQQLQVSIAVAGAMNPKLKVIRVRDGSLLDTESMGILAEYAERNDMQIWIERVSDGDGPGIVIEEGMVKGAEHKEAAE